MLVHDCFSSVGVTSGVLAKTLWTGPYTYVDRAGSLARFRIGPREPGDRARLLRELPWFARNLGLKALLRLRAVARALGHAIPYDPY